MCFRTTSAPSSSPSDGTIYKDTIDLGADDALPTLTGVPTTAGDLTFAPLSITFLAIPGANNDSCQ